MATVNRDRLPGHPSGPFRGEELHPVRDVLGLAEPPHRDAGHQLGLALGAVAVPLDLGGRVGQDEPGRDAVHRDAERAELGGQLAGQPDLAGLGAGVRLDSGPADGQPGGRGDVHDPGPTAAKKSATACGLVRSAVSLSTPCTVAPSSVRALAIAVPIPCAVPVTTAVRPASPIRVPLPRPRRARAGPADGPAGHQSDRYCWPGAHGPRRSGSLQAVWMVTQTGITPTIWGPRSVAAGSQPVTTAPR